MVRKSASLMRSRRTPLISAPMPGLSGTISSAMIVAGLLAEDVGLRALRVGLVDDGFVGDGHRLLGRDVEPGLRALVLVARDQRGGGYRLAIVLPRGVEDRLVDVGEVLPDQPSRLIGTVACKLHRAGEGARGGANDLGLLLQRLAARDHRHVVNALELLDLAGEWIDG